ncbi:pectinesterase-like [Arachis ipaensis]|uniref:pectinesterase-like n=1 Tax=Arachis ipaensis TaxID=130454 RepID=UPI000A2B6F05|nr:pectinesterase-like [Arachis ipaensis]
MGNLVIAYIILAFYSLFIIVHGTDKLSCNQTPYPTLCNHYIGTTNYSISSSSSDVSSSYYSFHDMALKVTMDQAIVAHKLVSSTMESNDFKDKRAKSAWEDCLELYENTIYQLNRSMNSNNLNDRLTWQSASIANQQTCQNGFLDSNLSSHYLNYFPSISSNLSKLLSNSLAISNTLTSLTSLPKDPVVRRGRKLLSFNGFPEWLSPSDRRLLQALPGTAAPKADIVVAQDGSGNYKSVSEGVAAAGRVSKNGRVNYINNVTLWLDFDSAVSSDGFIARDLTIENSAGPQKHQAVALLSSSDHSVFYRCSFRGYQDTLYVLSQRQFYRDCDIYGTIDFIFGDAVALFQNCNIFLRKPMSKQQNAVTAQGRTDPNENTGIVIHNCRIMAASDLKPVQGSVKCFLGRPWQKYSRTVVVKSSLDGLIQPAGWMPWAGSFALNTLYYGEYMNIGAGANTAGRVKWPGFHVITNPTEALKFTVANFLDGGSWIPGTGVPFETGL